MEKQNSTTIKCVIWDLDNTIWQGILSENDELTLKKNIKKIIKEMDQRGIIHSIASRNNYEDAIAQLEAFGLNEYFLYPQIHWKNKSESVKTIVEKLKIGYDTIAFIDDQDFERDEVKFAHCDVHCYSEEVIPSLLEKPEFIPKFITKESVNRRQMYLLDEIRNKEEKEIGNNTAFLESLRMKFKITLAKTDDLRRCEELTVRTNQLNSTGYTYSYDELESFITSSNHMLLVAELTDKYGSYGKIGLSLIEKNNDAWEIHLLLMSCRVLSRGVGTVLLYYIMNLAIKNKVTLFANFLQTNRNRIMYMTYKFAGFVEVKKDGEKMVLQSRNKELIKYPDYIIIKN